MIQMNTEKYHNRYRIKIKDGEKTVGSCYIATTNSPYNHQLELWAFYVEPEYRGKGLGTQILKEATSYAQKFQKRYKSNRPLVLFVYKDNKRAINLYKRNGFEIVGDYRKDAYVMKYCA